MSTFVRLVPMVSPEACCVASIEDYDDDFLLLDPEPLAEDFPEAAHYVVNRRVMESIGIKPTSIVGDLLRNQDSVLLCSPLLAEALAPCVGPHETLPVAIKHGKQSAGYVILRPLQRVKVIDLSASNVTPDNDDLVAEHISKLVLDEAGVPSEIGLFVAQHRSGEYLIRRTLAESLATRFAGIYTKELADPTGS